MGVALDDVLGISATGNIVSSQGVISATGNLYAGNAIGVIVGPAPISVSGNITAGNIRAVTNANAVTGVGVDGNIITVNMLASGTMSSTGTIQGGSGALGTPLPVSSGGTGAATLTGAFVGSGTGAVTAVAASTSYNSLISDGTAWTSSRLVGGTWTACSNRSLNVNYTNDTGKWMQVCGNFGCNGGGQGQIYIDGALVSYWAAQFNGCGGYSVNMPCLVPPGSTYQLAMGGGFRSWYELR